MWLMVSGIQDTSIITEIAIGWHRASESLRGFGIGGQGKPVCGGAFMWNLKMRRNQQFTGLSGSGCGQTVSLTLGQKSTCRLKFGKFEEQKDVWCDWSVMSWGWGK